VDAEPRILALEVTRTVLRDPMTQDQVLGACRGTDRIGLDEADRLERVRQRHSGKEAARDRVPAQVVDGHSTPIIVPWRYRAVAQDD